MNTSSTPAFEPVIGLEVHAELLTRSKMFCACPVVEPTAAGPNSAVCEVCTGMPGTLPVINRRAVEFALRAALALECRVATTSVFARKNYFYPDLPKGYQISQYDEPLAVEGGLEIEAAPGAARRVAIRRVHLEEDTGKLNHVPGASLVDYNRSGVPLLEVVSEPELYSLDEVKAYATALRSVLRYLEITTGDMEKGAMRFEANVSLRPAGSDGLGTRTEIKNLNSFRAMLRALGYEIERQGRVLAAGGAVAQETLRWNEAKGLTLPERGKEEADDYRYFPEPDLPPLEIDPAWLDSIRSGLPELPGARTARLVRSHDLPTALAGVLTADRAVADFFEAALAAQPGLPPERIAHWLSGETFGLLNQAGLDLPSSHLEPGPFAALVAMVEGESVSAASGKAILAQMIADGTPPQAVAAARGLEQIRDDKALDRLVEQVVRSHPEQVAQYLDGKAPIAEWLLGQVMRAARGRAHPGRARQRLERSLEARAKNRRGS